MMTPDFGQNPRRQQDQTSGTFSGRSNSKTRQLVSTGGLTVRLEEPRNCCVQSSD
jgi:hypothetical protein